MDFHDLCSGRFSKELSFEAFCRFDNRAEFGDLFLIDDMVADKEIILSDKRIKFIRAYDKMFG
jgi:hypothetical protein